VAGLALRIPDPLGCRLEVGPLLGHACAVAVEEILAIVEQSSIDEPRHSYELAIDRVIVDDGRELLLLQPLWQIGIQVDQMRGEQARPDDVDLEYIDIRGLRRQDLQVEGEAICRRVRRRDELYLIAGLLGPSLGAGLAELVFDAEGTAGDGDRRRGGRG